MAASMLKHTLFYSLEKATRAYRQFAQANIAAAGIDITIDQWLVLKTLQENPDATQHEIGMMVFKDFASITRILQVLVDKGFVSRAAHASDGRRSALTLTRAGVTAIRQVEPVIDSNRRRALSGVTLADVERARGLLDRIIANCQAGHPKMMRRVGVAAFALVAAASGAEAQRQPPPPVTAAVRSAVVDSVRRALATYYVFPDTAVLMAKHLDTRRRARAFDTLSNPNAFAAMISRELRRVRRDPHLRISYDPQEAARAVDTTRREGRDLLQRDRKRNFHFHQARILPGNIGYLDFTLFADTSAEARRTVRAAMTFVSNADALIIDLRENRGGSIAMANEILGYFVRDSAHWTDTYNRLTDKWTGNWTVNRPEITGGVHLGMPVTVIIGPFTYSAAEAIAYTLQQSRNARVVGEPSAGGAHVTRRVALGNGFVAYIPYIRGVSVVTRTNWEGTGVIPDVRADGPVALLRAQEAVLNERLAATSDTAARRAIHWALNEARAAALELDVLPAVIGAYAGKFEEYTFTVRDGRLYSENSSRNGKTDRMRAITPALFQVDRESQVEFLRDTTGAVSSIRVLWNDGWVDTIERK